MTDKAPQKNSWEDLENRYITSKVSYTQLAHESGKKVSDISRYAAAHDWRQKRQARAEMIAATSASGATAPAEERLNALAHRLLDKVAASVDVIDPLDTSGMKQLADTLRIVRDVTSKDGPREQSISVVLDEKIKEFAK